jgi:hypothetical protein
MPEMHVNEFRLHYSSKKGEWAVCHSICVSLKSSIYPELRLDHRARSQLGRQPGSKNKQPRSTTTSSTGKTTVGGPSHAIRKAPAKFSNDDASETSSDAATSGHGGAHHLPNPLHVLAAEARRLTSGSEDE